MAFAPKAPNTVGLDPDGYKETSVCQGAKILHDGWMLWKRLAMARVPDAIVDALNTEVRIPIHKLL